MLLLGGENENAKRSQQIPECASGHSLLLLVRILFGEPTK